MSSGEAVAFRSQGGAGPPRAEPADRSDAAWVNGFMDIAGKEVEPFLRAMGRAIGPPWQAKHKMAAAAAALAAAAPR